MALQGFERNLSIGLGPRDKLLGFDEVRTWLPRGFALTFWYFERTNQPLMSRRVAMRSIAAFSAGKSCSKISHTARKSTPS
jgi:hypothetical protein